MAGTKLLTPQHLGKRFVDQGAVGDCKEHASGMSLTQTDHISLADQRLTAGENVHVSAQLRALTNNVIQHLMLQVQLASVPFLFKRHFSLAAIKRCCFRPCPKTLCGQRTRSGSLQLASKKYPLAAEKPEQRAKHYNEGVASAKKPAAEGKVLLAAPDDTCGVSTLSRDADALRQLYEKAVGTVSEQWTFGETGSIQTTRPEGMLLHTSGLCVANT